MTQLSEFRQTGALPGATEPDGLSSARESQAFLLRVWALEEKILELAALDKKCADLDAQLLDILLEDTVNWLPDHQRTFNIDLSPLPQWDAVAEHMLHFAPHGLPLLIEGKKAQDIDAKWLPAAELLPQMTVNHEKLLACRATLASLGNGSRSYKNAAAANMERLWLIMED